VQQSRKLLGETLFVVGLVFAAFGTFLVWEGEPLKADASRRISLWFFERLLLLVFDPVTATRVFGFFSIGFGIALSALGALVYRKARPD
jgi:ABC-type Mn2+/Zn2+ transport system permease subunit